MYLESFRFPVCQGYHLSQKGLSGARYHVATRRGMSIEGLRMYRSSYQGHELWLTEGTPKQSSAKGMVYWHAGILNEEMEWFWRAPLQFFRSAVHYVRFSHHVGPVASREQNVVRTVTGRILILLAWPVGRLVYALDCKRTRANDARG